MPTYLVLKVSRKIMSLKKVEKFQFSQVLGEDVGLGLALKGKGNSFVACARSQNSTTTSIHQFFANFLKSSKNSDRRWVFIYDKVTPGSK